VGRHPLAVKRRLHQAALLLVPVAVEEQQRAAADQRAAEPDRCIGWLGCSLPYSPCPLSSHDISNAE
jgi:hypothetical protein